jgi:hypothetical protein
LSDELLWRKAKGCKITTGRRAFNATPVKQKNRYPVDHGIPQRLTVCMQ